MKKNINITIDLDVYTALVEKRLNISKSCNECLRHVLSLTENSRPKDFDEFQLQLSAAEARIAELKDMKVKRDRAQMKGAEKGVKLPW